jgi:hypothetical protein
VGVFSGAINSIIELDRLRMKRGDAVHVPRYCGFVQVNKESWIHIGAAGHAPVSAEEYSFRQQIVRPNQQAKVWPRPNALTHRMKVAHVQAAVLQTYDVGLRGSLDHRWHVDPEARV